MAFDRFMKACRLEPVDRPPIWLMRQAGRYLPEYREMRSKHDFLTLCKTPELAARITLLPLEKFKLDAAILFADIMLPLEGMGVSFEIIEGVGPVVEHPVRTFHDVAALHVADPRESVPYVLEAVQLVRGELKDRAPLIGFTGAPFTLASYLVEGKPTRSFSQVKAFMFREPEAWDTLMRALSEVVLGYAVAQIEAGAQAMQLFDSWVGCLSPEDYRQYVLPYISRVFEGLAPFGVPRIHFGTGTATLLEAMAEAGGDVMGVDWRIPLDAAWERIGPHWAVQGNLDPAVLLGSNSFVRKRAQEVLERAGARPGHIFNLGHGVLPDTPPENVTQLIEVVCGGSEQH